MKVLIVEDQSELLQSIQAELAAYDITTDSCDDGNEGLKKSLSEKYDAIVLDIMLPGCDGLTILQTMRTQGVKTPVLLLTARDGLDDRVTGLNLGADDYLAKPFYMEELIARLRALTRRVSPDSASNMRSIAGLTINLITRQVEYKSHAVDLSPREFNLLEYLTRTPGRIYSKTQILEHVWSYHFDPQSNIVEVHIQRLRSKLDDKDREAVIETVRGTGYRVRATGSEVEK